MKMSFVFLKRSSGHAMRHVLFRGAPPVQAVILDDSFKWRILPRLGIGDGDRVHMAVKKKYGAFPVAFHRGDEAPIFILYKIRDAPVLKETTQYRNDAFFVA